MEKIVSCLQCWKEWTEGRRAWTREIVQQAIGLSRQEIVRLDVECKIWTRLGIQGDEGSECILALR